jgi:hypothetical protein
VKIFNLENSPKGKPANKTECIVIGTFEEWQEIMTAIESYSKANPRKAKIRKIVAEFEDHLAVY